MSVAELARLIDEAHQTHEQMQDALRTAGNGAMREIVRLRTRFATLVSQMLGAMKADPRLATDAALRREFETRFFEMRQSLGAHQGKWRSADIEADPDGYRRATADLNRDQNRFYSWARTAL